MVDPRPDLFPPTAVPETILLRAGSSSDDDVRERLGWLTRTVRYTELDRLVGINRQTLRGQIEGPCKPTVQLVSAVSVLSGVSADWILFGRGEAWRRKKLIKSQDSV